MTERYKKTALHLHGLAEIDRRWLLEQLPEEERKKLLFLLEELVALGIPQQPIPWSSLAEPWKKPDRLGAGGESASEMERCINLISNAAPSTVITILNNESDAVLAAVLHVHDWPWRQIVLEELDLSRRAQVPEIMKNYQGRLTRKVREAIVKTFAEQVACVPLPQPLHNDYTPEIRRYPWKWNSFKRFLWRG